MGYIGLEELSNNLKDYLKGLGLTENQVNEAIKQITGDKAQLQTSNKNNLVATINEVFQSGINVKQGLVEAFIFLINIIDNSVTEIDRFISYDSGPQLVSTINPKNGVFYTASFRLEYSDGGECCRVHYIKSKL